MELYILKPNGDYNDYRNVADAVWSANQAQIQQWITSRGYTFYTESANDTDPDVVTMTNLDQVQGWIYQMPTVSATASAEGPPAASSPATSSSGDVAIGVGVGVGFLALLGWALSRV